MTLSFIISDIKRHRGRNWFFKLSIAFNACLWVLQSECYHNVC